MDIGRGDTLLLVHLQQNVLPSRALAVSQGVAVVPALNRYLEPFRAQQLPVLFTRNVISQAITPVREAFGRMSAVSGRTST